MAEEWTVDQFRPLLNQQWQLYADDQQYMLELIEVTDLPHHTHAADLPLSRQPFSLVFRGAAEIVLPQRMYRIEHPNLSVEAMFLVPVGRTAQGTLYEAVYS